MDLTHTDTDEKPLDFSPPPGPDGITIQVAPLIDTVLFLIWFYLLVGEMVIHQKDPSVQLPQMQNSLAMNEAPAEVIINLRQDGQVVVDGRDLDADQLRIYLAAQSVKAKQARAPLHVVVRADKRQSVGRLMGSVFRACSQCGIRNVSFRAKEGGG